jgi:metallo-beta-lactamase class B
VRTAGLRGAARAVFAIAIAIALPAWAADATPARDWTAQRATWNRPAAPFRILGNLYYVGTEGLAAYLLTDPRGHILIDGGLPESAPLIAANIRALGFRLRDVRVLLINHAHFDHAGGLAELKRLSGAALAASAADRADLQAGRAAGRDDHDPFPAVHVDRTLVDGEEIRVGATVLKTLLTPGHTRGCTSWTYDTKEAGRKLRVLFACSLTVAGQDLRGGKIYPDAVGDFRATFAKLRRLQPDVFLNFHAPVFDLAGKRAKQLAGDAFAFVDAGELGRQLDLAESAFQRDLASAQAR